MTYTNDEKKKHPSKIFCAKDAKPPKRLSSSINSSAVDFQGSTMHSAAASPAPTKNFNKTKSLSFKNFLSSSESSAKAEAFRVFVATWNVGGRTPPTDLNLDDFLPADDHSDIYVLGFQEIVPLNAGNVLVVEDNEPAARWLMLISQALNRTPETLADIIQFNPSSSMSSSSSSSSQAPSTSNHTKTASGTLILPKTSLKSLCKTFMPDHRRKLKICNCPVEIIKKSYRDACFSPFGCPQAQAYVNETDSSEEEEEEEEEESPCSYMIPPATPAQLRYNLVACKKMVGIFLCVWVRKELIPHVGHLRLSSIGRGILGYLGNKGCISVSMTLHQTTFCFVCSHLASGEKEGDQLRRNSDVIEILKSTQFRRVCRRGRRIPEKILDHDRVIWLGDLNYRIALSYSETKKLLEENNWDSLFEKDQLKIERDAGRVFKGWSEGKIYFAPTYKYLSNSDAYAAETVTSVKKRRTPSWCDRILWYGDGIVQLSYFRGESRFSDHRPVCAAFIVEIGALNGRLKKGLSDACS